MHWTNEYIINWLEDKSEPRAVCYFKNHKKIVIICFNRGNFIEYDHANNLITPVNSTSSKGWLRSDARSIDKSLCYRVYEKLKIPKLSNDEIIKKQYTFTKDKKRISDKDHELIAKYEQRKKGNWSDR